MKSPWVFAAARIESLCQRLALELGRQAGGDPFRPDIVLVGSRGMERWLQAELATRWGVCMNVRFDFLARGLAEQLSAPAADGTNKAAWTVEQMTLGLLELMRRPRQAKLFSELPPAVFSPAGDALAVVDDVQLAWARGAADTLDKLAIFRPEWMGKICAGETYPELEREPQGRLLVRLWPSLEEHLGRGHLFHLLQAARVAGPELSRGPVLHLFGLVALAPLYLEAARLLAGFGRARLYLLAPWQRAARQNAAAGPGCELGQALGRFGASFLEELGQDELFWLERERAAEPLPLLDGIQRAVEHDLPASDTEGLRLAADDPSFQVHACCGPMRQVEVLKDALLDWFSREPALEPRQVLVMTPQVEKYAPLVQAVFSQPASPGDESGRTGVLPLRLADRPLLGASGQAGALLRLLELAAGRLSASAIFDFLALEPVRRRFSLEAGQMNEVRCLFEESGLRWGADEAERQLHGLPRDEGNTVEFALSRLAAGVVADAGELVQAGEQWLAPVAGQTGERLEIAGRVAAYLRALTGVVGRLRGGAGADAARTLPRWRELLLQALDDLCAADDEAAQERSALVAELDDWMECGRRAAFAGSLSLRAVRRELALRLSDTGRADRPISQAVTLCSFKPLRSVPYAVICLLGMDDGEFPREAAWSWREWFDSGSAWRDGDSRAEDMNLLLETVMSARRALIITYQGSDPCSNEARHPAGPVAALLDFVRTLAGRRGGGNDWPVVRHPLQPFSRRYFSAGGDLHTYHGWAGRMARGLAGARAQPEGLFADPRGGGQERLDPEPPKQQPQQLELEELLDFFLHPARHLLRHRLGLRLEEREALVAEREPVDLSGLDTWELNRRLLDFLLQAAPEKDAEDFYSRLRAEGWLPLGEAGRRLFLSARQEMEKLLVPEARERLLRQQELPLRVVVEGVRDQELERRVEVCARARWAPGSPGRLFRLVHDQPDKSRHLLRTWLQMLCIAGQSDVRVEAAILGKDGQVHLAFPLPDRPESPAGLALDELRRLLELYFAGRRRPLPLPLESGRSSLENRKQARSRYFDRFWPEHDHYWAACFPETPPVELEEFYSLARLLWEPLAAARFDAARTGKGVKEKK